MNALAKLKRIIPILFLLIGVNGIAFSQDIKVRFYPTGKLTYCKECGHLKESFWNFKFRLENRSTEDLIIFGSRDDEGFRLLTRPQYRSPDVCEWQYWWGSSNNRGGLNSESDHFKQEAVLKAGEAIETTGGTNEFGSLIPERVLTYVSRIGDAEPIVIFSEPYIAEMPSGQQKSDDNGKPIAPLIRIVDDKCSPACTLSIEQSPSVQGIRLGMSIYDFKKLYPNVKVTKADKNKVIYAWWWNWNEDAYSFGVTFFRDEVVRLEVKFKSLEDKRSQDNFYTLVAERLGLPNFGTAYNSKFECREFLIDVLNNKMPTITIWNKSFIDVHDKFAEQEWKNKK